MQQFLDAELPLPLIESLKRMRFNTPTPIQAKAIPLVLAGKDILGSAQTGTGKTGAFAIPIVAKLLTHECQRALILTPTRELASQVMDAITQLLGKKSGIHAALLIGGESMPKQLRQLREHPQVIVGTPGRVNDHLQRETLDLSQTDFLVLDETDRMLDMGFNVQLEKIARHLPKTRQTLMFSATMPDSIVKLSRQYLQDPVRVQVGSMTVPLDQLTQEIVQVKEEDKYSQLVAQLDRREGSIIVFVKTKRGADRLATKLSREDYNARAIHGDLRQHQRNRVIHAFRNRKYRIMIATDVAARGLDIPHIEHVINYDLPQQPEDYVHRIGRTARAGAKGSAINFITPQDKRKWHAIDCLLDPSKKSIKVDPPRSKRSRFNKNKSNKRFDFKKPRQRGRGKPGRQSASQ
jgi:ATP-dependent RNA helicase DeaD